MPDRSGTCDAHKGRDSAPPPAPATVAYLAFQNTGQLGGLRKPKVGILNSPTSLSDVSPGDVLLSYIQSGSALAIVAFLMEYNIFFKFYLGHSIEQCPRYKIFQCTPHMHRHHSETVDVTCVGWSISVREKD
jgi:hypothetical protein